MSFWPEPNGPNCWPTACPAAPRSRTTIPSRASAKTSARCARDYTTRERDSLSAAYTIDDGNSLIPLADPLFGSYGTPAHAGGQPAGDAHLLAARAEHLPRGLLARGVQSTIRLPLGDLPAEPLVRHGRRPGRHRGRRRHDHHRLSRHHGGGPEQRGRRLEPAQPLHVHRQLADQRRAVTRSAPASGSSACGTTKTPPRAVSARPVSPA